MRMPILVTALLLVIARDSFAEPPIPKIVPTAWMGEQAALQRQFAAVFAGFREPDEDWPSEPVSVTEVHTERHLPKSELSLAETTEFGVVILAFGVAGWFALAIGAWVCASLKN